MRDAAEGAEMGDAAEIGSGLRKSKIKIINNGADGAEMRDAAERAEMVDAAEGAKIGDAAEGTKVGNTAEGSEIGDAAEIGSGLCRSKTKIKKNGAETDSGLHSSQRRIRKTRTEGADMRDAAEGADVKDATQGAEIEDAPEIGSGLRKSKRKISNNGADADSGLHSSQG